MRRIWKEYFEGLYNEDAQEPDPVHMCGFDGTQRVRKLNIGNDESKDDETGEVTGW